ncbi:MAG: acyl-CoA synthetase [Gaiellaceae bacterium MAG52_C11]|nr:acyl-CoA synthetase [Candidatus Gaiellasilicea maunaloa]
MTSAADVLPPGFLEIPERLNIADRIVSRHVREGRGGRPALQCEGASLTYAELEERCNRAGNALLTLGLEPGDRFVIRAQNSLDYAATVLGGMKIGAVPIPSTTLFRAWEVGHTIVNSDSKLVLTGADVREPVDEVASDCPTLRDILVLESEFAELMAHASPELDAADTGADDPAYAIYTSGSTGKPKGVEHAHRMIVAAGDPVAHIQLRLTADDHMMVPIELSSLITLDFSILWPLSVGAQGSLFCGRFEPARFLAEVERLKLTIFMGVPTMFRFLLSVPDVERYDLSSVRMTLVGGEPLPEDTYRAVKRTFGFEMYEMIGSTEGHPYIANVVGRPPRIGSMGLPLPGRRCAIVDDAGRELPNGEVGNLCLASDDPALALGYRKQEEQWRALHRRGWFYSGDLAYRDDDGYFWFHSRADDVILSRAYRISPGEVESATMTHPDVLESGVVGVADPELGQRIRAYVVLKHGRAASEELAEEIRETVRGVIAPYKVPKEIQFVAELPKTMSGKIQRKVLRERAASGGN